MSLEHVGYFDLDFKRDHELSPIELCDRIEVQTTQMMSFWKSASGWASIKAAKLLNKSMLEWQISLSSSLKRWCSASSNGDLILAWANLGALVEGQLKLFLSIYYDNYLEDYKRFELTKSPGKLMLNRLREFFVQRKIWTEGTDWNPYVESVQQHRNAIHAFQKRDIGTFDDWRKALQTHLSFIKDMDSHYPYPDNAHF